MALKDLIVKKPTKKAPAKAVKKATKKLPECPECGKTKQHFVKARHPDGNDLIPHWSCGHGAVWSHGLGVVE